MKHLNIGLGWEMVVYLTLPVESASLVSFIEQNVSNELKLRYPNLNISPVEIDVEDLDCGFTDETINTLGKSSSGSNATG